MKKKKNNNKWQQMLVEEDNEMLTCARSEKWRKKGLCVSRQIMKTLALFLIYVADQEALD